MRAIVIKSFRDKKKDIIMLPEQIFETEDEGVMRKLVDEGYVHAPINLEENKSKGDDAKEDKKTPSKRTSRDPVGDAGEPAK